METRISSNDHLMGEKIDFYDLLIQLYVCIYISNYRIMFIVLHIGLISILPISTFSLDNCVVCWDIHLQNSIHIGH